MQMYFQITKDQVEKGDCTKFDTNMLKVAGNIKYNFESFWTP